MKYFVNEEARKVLGGTCYFEFQRGKQDNCWLNDSICLHADLFDEFRLFSLFSASLGTFDYYGSTIVNEEKWSIIIEKSRGNEQWESVVQELKPWVEECFIEHRCFTICGI